MKKEWEEVEVEEEENEDGDEYDKTEVQKESSEGEGNSSMVVTIDTKLLHCFICSQLLQSSPIFQCKTGHVSCSHCYTSAGKTCSKCSLTLDRSMGLEAIINSIKIPCPNSSLGCKETIPYINKHIHQTESCLYSPCSCPMKDCTFRSSMHELSAHFSSQHLHGAKLLFGHDFFIRLRKEEPFRVIQAEDDRLFLLLNSQEIHSGYSLSVVCIGPGILESDLQYELKVRMLEPGNTLCLKAGSVTKMREWRGVYPANACFLFVPVKFCSQTGLSKRIPVHVRVEKINQP